MAQTPEQKAAKYLIDALADSRFSETGLANRIMDEKYDIQARFWNVLVAYIYSNSLNYELGLFPHDTYTISRLSKKIKDFVFADEYKLLKNSVYGDYELANDLTEFDTT
jgi:hypothetical protein